MNIIDLNKRFYYQFPNRIYQSGPIYEFVPSTQFGSSPGFGGVRAIGLQLKIVKDYVSKKAYER